MLRPSCPAPPHLGQHPTQNPSRTISRPAQNPTYSKTLTLASPSSTSSQSQPLTRASGHGWTSRCSGGATSHASRGRFLIPELSIRSAPIPDHQIPNRDESFRRSRPLPLRRNQSKTKNTRKRSRGR
ncbi:hypothetical protein COCNU_14G000760 [Cocos nucifera]|uniref:Uncharacterized protein n=1 Tax=Cocos nucifera TaxID=13894 RepID=A0A8K0IUK2_COCNU|nr:hypothetical protein COCNU_14G000760 [Cocos nucifera]